MGRTNHALAALAACAVAVACGSAAAQQKERSSSGSVSQAAKRDVKVSGRITLAAGSRQSVVPEEVAQAVIYFLPDAGAPRPAPRRLSAATYTKGFDPSLLVATVGSTVSFPNRDTIIHNVFSATPGSAFDLGTFGPGETRTQRFDRPGLVVVSCNVHRGMRANVIVLGTPYSTQARPDGSFSLAGIPEGAGTLVIWHPRAAAYSTPWNGRKDLRIDRRLVAVRPRIGSTP